MDGRQIRDRPVVLFITDTSIPNEGDGALFTEAEAAGFRVFWAPFEDLGPTPGCLQRGFDVVGGRVRPLVQPITVRPDVIMHRAYLIGARAERFDALTTAFPEALVSCHPELPSISSKWGTELLVRQGPGIRRPRTYLLPTAEMLDRLRGVGRSRRLLFKPDHGSQGRGIHLSTPATFDATVAGLDPDVRYVVQELVDPALRVDGRRFDIRLYAFFMGRAEPQVFRDGIVRIASARDTGSTCADPDAVLTNCAYRHAASKAVENWTVDRLLHHLAADGHDVTRFWERVDALAAELSTAVAGAIESSAAHRCFLVTGMDLLLVDDGDGVAPVFIEHNYTPLFHGFGAEVDPGLRRTMRAWLERLRRLVAPDAGLPIHIPGVTEQPPPSKPLHPLADLLPSGAALSPAVSTAAQPGARFDHLDPALANGTGELRSELARLIVEPDTGPPDRYVEPGVGRSVLIPHLRFDDDPTFHDFSATGVGLTPYSRDGMAVTGPHMDGLMPLIRARHRHRMSLLLSAAGVRVPRTAAVVSLEGTTTAMPDGSRVAAGLIVRGFRTVLRVQQLDPLANLVLGDAHRPVVAATLEQLGIGAGSHAAVCLCYTPGQVLETDAGGSRRRLMVRHGSRLIEHVLPRLADGPAQVTDAVAYARWFAATLAGQMAILRRIRFLHDYRRVRPDCDSSHSLAETNVTLLAELADLDTGVCLSDADGAAMAHELRIDSSELTALEDRFDDLHQEDVAQARNVVRVLAYVATEADRDETARIVAAYEERYERATGIPIRRGRREVFGRDRRHRPPSL